MTLRDYASALEKSRKPADRAVARFIREHERRLNFWLRRFSQRLPREDRDELQQVALLAVVQAVTGAEGAEVALENIIRSMHRESDRSAAWNARRRPTPHDEKEND